MSAQKLLLIPCLISMLVLALALLPVDIVAMVGCKNRGLWAIFLALLSGLVGIATGASAIIGRIRGRETAWQIAATALYALPILLVLYFA